MKHLIIAVIVSFAVAFGTVKLADHPAGSAAPQETVYEKVMRTKTLRCGWFIEPLMIDYDANTGQRSGVVIDIMDQFTRDYGIKIEWETISNYAMMGEDLKEGKYDAVCASLIDMPRGGLIEAGDPFLYEPIYAYVRSDDNRLTSLDQLNNPDIRLATQEGSAITIVAHDKFPNAQAYVTPTADLAEMLTSVVSGKADVGFGTPMMYQGFVKNNGNALKPLDPEHPLQVFYFAFGFRPQEEGIKSMLNATLRRMIVSGQLATLYAKHDSGHTLIYPTVSASAKVN